MLSENMLNMLNRQVNAEIQAAYLYLSMSLDAESKDMTGVANWFYVQWLEELHHARLLQMYILSRNGKVALLPLESVPTEWQTLKDMFSSTLRHERIVTQLIHNITAEATREQDFATLNRMIWFVDEQVEEEATARTLLNRVSQIENNRAALMILDKELAERKSEND